MYHTDTGGIQLPEPSRAMRSFSNRSKGHFTGSLVVGPGRGRVIRVESHLELNVALILAARADVLELEEQVAFDWRDSTGTDRTHFFDFRVRLTNGRQLAISVKPASRLEKHAFLEEMAQIAGQVSPAFADEVRIFTDGDIDPVELHNARLMQAMRRPDPEADGVLENVIADRSGAMPIASLVQLAGLGARGFNAVVRLIRARRITPVGHGRISPETLVWCGGSV